MNRIDKKFKELKEIKKKAFIAFITAGDPSLKVTTELVIGFEKSGVDIVEFGVPFSDPLADGTTIQASSQRALKNGVTLKKILNAVKDIRKKSQIPLALMMYYNPVFHYGLEKFLKDAKSCGVDGLIIPDLPPEEASDLIKEAKVKEISTIFFLAPTTTDRRTKDIVKVSSGFIYYVSLTGVTGARSRIPSEIAGKIKRAKKYTLKPICVGFGISTPAQVKQVSKYSDGVIVGSAIVNEINKYQGSKVLVGKVSKYVKRLSTVL